MAFGRTLTPQELYDSATRNLSLVQIAAVQQGDLAVIGDSSVMQAARRAYVALQK